ncbi:hypothetical protein SD435_07140 [Kosakonia cowanii]|uniref:hypothetical protein n=1 Tax=Kosakonia cowanii TaxID=208223 RepID=UPI0029C8418E|nr:hypothetical protein [Kosakonia cowanii]WPG22221.1 hypothetical protein SD435_07140 [Kosakonia cowanii]
MKKNNIFNSTVITGYLFLLSIAYLWGFWGNFQINILQFISVQDILKASIIPMIVTLVLYFAQVAINNFNSPKGDIKNLTDLSKQEKIDVGIKISYVVIISLLTLISIIHALFFGSLMQRYSVAGFIAALTLSIALGQKKKLWNTFPAKIKY